MCTEKSTNIIIYKLFIKKKQIDKKGKECHSEKKKKKIIIDFKNKILGNKGYLYKNWSIVPIENITYIFSIE